MKKAIWFSRHAPTEAQINELAQRGYEIVALDEGMSLGGMSMDDDGDVYAVGQALFGLCAETEAALIAGVFAAPVQEVLYRTAADAVQTGEWGEAIPCLAAWNVMRSPDGGTPTFEHRRFVQVGALSSAVLRRTGCMDANDKTTTAACVGSTPLFCPSCGVEAHQDHNAFWCDDCEQLWPKGVDGDYWETQGQEKHNEISCWAEPHEPKGRRHD